MAYADQGKVDLSFTSAADLSAEANQYKFVKLDANGEVVLCTAAGESAIGVLQNRPKLGEQATVRAVGVSKVQADAALNEGDRIATSADAQAKAASALVQATGAASNVLGIALTAPSAAGVLFSAYINVVGGIVPTSAA